MGHCSVFSPFLRYELHFRALGTPGDPDNYNITTTAATALRLENLTPNTQYVIYVTATTDKGESRPSETLLAWTDPAYPAFVEVSHGTLPPHWQALGGPGTMARPCQC